MSGSTLVSTGELAANLAKWRVFDCRHDLAKPDLGEQQYRESHVPGAMFAHLDRDLSGRKSGTSIVVGRPSFTHCAKPPSSTATWSWPIQRSIHHRRAAMEPGPAS